MTAIEPDAPSDPSAPDPSARDTALRMIGRLRADRAGFGSVLMAGVGGVAASVAGPILIGRAVDVIVTGMIGRSLPRGESRGQVVDGLRADGRGDVADVVSGLRGLRPGSGVDFGRLSTLLVVLLVLYLLAAALGWVQGRLTTRVVQRATNRLRHDVEVKLSRLPLRYVDSVGRGEIVSRVTNDVDNVATGLQQTLSQLLTAVLTVLAVLTFMFVVSPLLSLVAIVSVPLSLVLTRVIGRRARVGFLGQWKGVGKLNAHVEEVYSGHQIVAMSGQQQAMRERFDAHNDAVYQSGLRAQFASGTLSPLTTFVSSLNYVAVAVLGGLRVTTGSLSIGDVQAMLSYTRQASAMLSQAVSTANLLQSALASAARVFELLDEPEEPADEPRSAGPDEPQDHEPLGPDGLRGRIEFEDVHFAYDAERPVIAGLDLVVAAGSTVAVVGPTGAGKSTLAALMLRFYDVDSGCIRFDGLDIRTLERTRLRHRFAVVPQDNWLFQGTIAANIRYGDVNASDDAIRAAAAAACLDHLIETLPEGYDTVISPDHPVLSAGERQLLTIARAFLADPLVLILDEATSAVDSYTEALVQRATSRLTRGRTAFVVAHRLRTIERADLILLLDAGRVVEQGTHAELLAAQGGYAQLHRAQYLHPLTSVER